MACRCQRGLRTGIERNVTEVWTVARMLGWSDGYLQRSGSSTARLDAELLLGEALGMRRLDLYLAFDRPMNATELAAYKRLISRRATMEPVAYILGRKAFYDIEVSVGPGVLVPRPETETNASSSSTVNRSEKAPP